ncbi:hypothetical protein N7520_000429 [Penicillium odoratum]|uniref:uncharacterized protein n=1 Tax=Penicillium odoratum TaxID=1167516 RepID=UPI0025479BDA|nr:uncharacterized protein N7520_000429 [Penicillium odoratum]KAJ5777183.1 hypothetical protein N7520_000429 [Penicillium odoratum]
MRAASILSFLTLGALASASALAVESRSSPSEAYCLYGYGEGVGGLTLYYSEGNAVIGKKAPPNATEVSCKSASPFHHHIGYLYGSHAVTPSSGGSIVGNPRNGTSKSFSDQELFIPTSSSNHQIGFTSNSTGNSHQVTNKFVWYGHFLLVETETGEYTSLFYAKKTEYEDLYFLQWNVTDEDDGDFISLSMRSIAPSNA